VSYLAQTLASTNVIIQALSVQTEPRMLIHGFFTGPPNRSYVSVMKAATSSVSSSSV
jgi:hypothetical protein